MTTLFLSHSSDDKALAERWREHLFGIGFDDVFIDNHSILPGQQWEPMLYQRLRSCRAVIALISANFNSSQWCFAEMTHARALHRPIVPVLLDGSALPALLADIQSQAVTGAHADALDRVRRGLESLGVRPDDRMAWDSRRPPYPGLFAFDAADAGVYFGREQEIRAVLDRTHDLLMFGAAPRALAILGGSGTGKSSLLRAGVLPRLALDPSHWVVPDPIRASQQPLSKLAQSLATALAHCAHPPTTEEILTQLGSPSAGAEILRAVCGDVPQRGVVIALDQLEELAVGEDKECLLLREWLGRAVQIEQPRILVLATVRSDRLPAVEAVAPWVTRGRLVPLAALAESDLLHSICEPARVAGLEVEAQLAQNLLADVRARQALPLLAFALRELWERRSATGKLQNSAYIDDLGRIDGAVRRAADTATASLARDPDDADALRVALLELAQVPPDGEISRRRVPRSRLPPRSAPSIDALISARLLVVDGDFIEVAHESLFGAWERLAVWVKEARSALIVRSEAQIDSERWARTQGDPEYLWSEARLERALALLRTSGVTLDSSTEPFVKASKEAVELQRQNEAKARNLEVSRLRKQRRTVMAVASVALLAAGVAFLFYFRARQALRDSLLQTARAACVDVSAGSRDIGLAALTKAAQIRPDADLRDAYVDCLEHPSFREVSHGAKLQPNAVKIYGAERVHSAGGVTATVRPAGTENTFEVRAESNGKPLAKWSLQASSVDSIRVSPDGTLVAVDSYDLGFEHQTLKLFAAHSGNLLFSLPAEDFNLGAMYSASSRISFDASGHHVAVAGVGGSVFAWNLQSLGNSASSLRARPFAAQALTTAISPDGRWVAAMDEGANIVVLAMETNQVVARTSAASHVPQLGAVDDRGLEWSQDDRIVLGPLQWQWLEPADQGFWVTSHVSGQRAINDLAFDSDGKLLAVGSEYGGTPYIAALSGTKIDVRHPTPVPNYDSLAEIERVVFTKENQVCASEWSSIFCMDIRDATREEIAPLDFRRTYRQLAYEPGQLLVSSERSATVMRVFDTQGTQIWERKFDSKTFGGPMQILIDKAGQQLAYRGLGTSNSFNTVRLSDGEPDGSFRPAKGSGELQMALLEGHLALLNKTDVSLRRLDETLLRGPLKQPKFEWTGSTFSSSEYLVAERSRSGGVNIWNLQTRHKCSIEGITPPRNKAHALSFAAQRYVAFDGNLLKVWDTSHCEEITTLGVVDDASDLSLSADGAQLRYRVSQSHLVTQSLRDQSKTEVALDPLQHCLFHVGSGWSDDASAFWDACRTRERGVAVRAWDTNTGRTRFDLKIPDINSMATVAVDGALARVVVATDVSQDGLSVWSGPKASRSESELCTGTPTGSAREGLRILDHGKRAAWVHVEEHGQAWLNTVDLSSCQVRAVKLAGPAEVQGGTPTGDVLVITGESVQALTPEGHIQWKAFGGLGQITHAAVSSDGAWVAASLADGTVVFGKIGELKPRMKLRGGPGTVRVVGVAPEGSWLAVGTEDGRVNLWRVKQMEGELARVALGPMNQSP